MVELQAKSQVRSATGRPYLSWVFLSWLAMLAVDVLLHAGLLAPLYTWQGVFLLGPAEAFARIPVGYAGLLLLAVGLTWLLVRLDVRGAHEGALMAGTSGGVVLGAVVLGLWSISTAEPGLLVGWWVGQSVELGVGGAVIGSLLIGSRRRAVLWRIAALAVLSVLATAVLQTIGYAKAPIVIH